MTLEQAALIVAAEMERELVYSIYEKEDAAKGMADAMSVITKREWHVCSFMRGGKPAYFVQLVL